MWLNGILYINFFQKERENIFNFFLEKQKQRDLSLSAVHGPQPSLL